MLKNKLFWQVILLTSLILGSIIFVNSLDISPPSKQVEKKLPNEKNFWKLLNRAIFLTIFFIPIFLQPSLADVKDIWKQSQNIKKLNLNLILNLVVSKNYPRLQLIRLPTTVGHLKHPRSKN